MLWFEGPSGDRVRVKWLRGNGVGSFSSPHPRCSLFDMAADPETETNLTSFPVNLKLSWARSGEQAGKKRLQRISPESYLGQKKLSFSSNSLKINSEIKFERCPFVGRKVKWRFQSRKGSFTSQLRPLKSHAVKNSCR